MNSELILEYEEEFESEAPTQGNFVDLIPLLREMYSDASEDEIQGFYKLITSNNPSKLPLSDYMKLYIEASAEAKLAEECKEEIRQKVLKEYQGTKHTFEGISFSKVKPRPLNDSKIYQWVSTLTTPEILEEITIKTVDYSKLDKLFTNGTINYELDEIPEGCYDTYEYFRINLPRRKK